MQIFGKLLFIRVTIFTETQGELHSVNMILVKTVWKYNNGRCRSVNMLHEDLMSNLLLPKWKILAKM